MKHVNIHTYDIINHDGLKNKYSLLAQCCKAATKCHINHRITSNKDIYLELWGSKHNFIKYYLITFFVGSNFKSAAKRLLDIATTH